MTNVSYLGRSRSHSRGVRRSKKLSVKKQSGAGRRRKSTKNKIKKVSPAGHFRDNPWMLPVYIKPKNNYERHLRDLIIAQPGLEDYIKK